MAGIVGPVTVPDGLTDAVAVLRNARIAAYAMAAGWSGDKAVTAVAIALAESSGNPTATNKNSNGSQDFGLWQVNSIHKPTEEEKFNGAANARKAYSIYKEAGSSFKPWVTYNTGAWTRHKATAQRAVNDANKKGAAWIKEAAESATTVDRPMEAVSVSVPNPLDGVGKMVGKVLNNVVLVLVALVFIVLGVVILARGSAMRMGKDFVKEFTGNQAAVQKAANAPPPKVKAPPLSVEEKARRSLEYSEIRKELKKEMDAEKAAAALEELRRKLGRR